MDVLLQMEQEVPAVSQSFPQDQHGKLHVATAIDAPATWHEDFAAGKQG